MPQKPSIPKGTRDFSPNEVAKRNYIISTIKKHFETFGFQPIETPSFENSETLLGKYGEEGDRLIFKILDSGDYIKKIHKEINDYNTYYSQIKNQLQNLCGEVDNQLGDSMRSGDININEFTSLNYVKDLYDFYFRRLVSYFPDAFSPYFVEVADNYKDVLLGWVFLAVQRRRFLDESSSSLVGERVYDYNIENYPIDSVYKTMRFHTVAMDSKVLASKTSEKALRYDLTVPFARYVVMHQNGIDFPFKRYQIQPVWRADRPQKGRFREFYQCDADVVGAHSLLQEVEFVQLYDAVFTELGLRECTIKMNNRKILSGIAEVIGAKHLLVDFTVALDKLDKIGQEKVKAEMLNKGISEAAIKTASPLFSMTGSTEQQLEQLKVLLKDSAIGLQGVHELEKIFELVNGVGLHSTILQLDVTLARGLNYYTGAIFEVAAPSGVSMGSIGGGGRYDDLTGIFGLKDVSGVGISFGLDRIYLVLEELGLFPTTIAQSLDVLCLNFGENEGRTALKLVAKLRQEGVRADLYPTATKVQKQFKYADRRNVPYVIMLGDKELAENNFVVKNMVSGEQQWYALNRPEEFIRTLQS